MDCIELAGGQGSLLGEDAEPVSVGSYHARRSGGALDVQMLVAMEEPSRLHPGDVAVERDETDVDLVVTVMDHAGRVVGNTTATATSA